MPDVENTSLAVLIPVYNDWEAVRALLPRLNQTLHKEQWRVTVVLIDDGSSEPANLAGVVSGLSSIERTILVSLRRNLGHQRAIAIGLTLVHERFPHDTLVIMDGDGQDQPEDVPRLVLEAHREGGSSIVFAERVRRSEGALFAVCYHVYRAAHLLLTGERVRFGNFSAVPRACLERLVSVSELWGHYAAAVIRSRIPYVSIVTTRARRPAGRPTMRFTGLVVHGLSALAIFSDVIGVRLLLASLLAVGTVLVTMLLGSPSLFRAAPGSFASLELLAIGLLLLVVTVGTMLAFTFMVLSSRQSSQFIPLRDYSYFVQKVTEL